MSNKTFGDERLKKDSGANMRGTRADADVDRVHNDGLALSAEERRRLLRQQNIQEVLPQPPKREGWHRCWLSTTNSTDPIYKRIALGYQPVKASDVPGFGANSLVEDGEFKGCIACNEMLLFEIPLQLFNDLMEIYHHDMPNEQEESIKERVQQAQQLDSSGRELMSTEGDFQRLGSRRGNPTFIH